ncbi:hypothetical protein NA57DRAFT_50822 [Rhizodiscina lignyota]|uniref:Uncharacterized protein n=1 Tax=Rhizodiscina lignyota TaxID=1504668 RepID=A0A9P4IT37_9PEZI|nr:hypothetical protein NA57DRAFT_50822 [Rhizodiscina lignyota]
MPWTSEGIAMLLAYLDNCIKRRKQNGFFQESVTKFLKNSIEEYFTWKQVSAKLRAILSHSHGIQGKVAKARGTKSEAELKELKSNLMGEAMKELIANGSKVLRFKRFGKGWTGIPISRSMVEEASRQIDAKSHRTDNERDASDIELRDAAQKLPSERHRSSRAQAETSGNTEANNHGISGTESVHEPATNHLRDQQSSKTPDHMEPNMQSKNVAIAEHSDLASVPTRPVPDIRQIEPDESIQDLPQESQCEGSLIHGAKDHGQVQESSKGASELDQRATPSNTREKAVDDQLKRMEERIAQTGDEYKEILNLLRSQQYRGQKEQSIPNDPTNILQTTRDEYASILAKKDEEINDLRNQLNDAQNAARYVGEVSEINHQIHVEQPMAVIFETRIKQAAQAISVNLSKPLQNPRPGSVAARLLIRACTGRPESLCTGVPTLDIMNMDPQAVVRALVAAFVQEQVFEEEWPKFDQDESRLLKYSREFIASQDGGLKFIQVVNHIAHKKLVNEASFKTEMVAGKVGRLMILLLEVLADIISPKKDNETPDIGANCILPMPSEHLLYSSMHKALLLKTQVLLSPNIFRSYHVPAGTQFNPKFMKMETKNMVVEELEVGADAVVKLCLSPAILYWDGLKTPEGRGRYEQVAFRYSTFWPWDPHDESQKDPYCHSKAIVIIE